MSKVEVVIDSVRMGALDYRRTVILKEKSTERYLPVWIGPAEADSISIKLQGATVPRPLTHDFVCAVIEALGAKVKFVFIDKFQNETFYAKFVMGIGREKVELDCRPSDALAVAIREKVPVYVESDILDKLGISTGLEADKPAEGSKYGKKVEGAEEVEVKSDEVKGFSDVAKEMLKSAEEEADQLGTGFIGTGHLLIALVRNPGDMSAKILKNLGVDPIRIVSAVESVVAQEEPLETEKLALNENARRTVEISHDEAKLLGNPVVLPEHLLIAMLREGKGIAAKVLKEHGVNVEGIYAQVIKLSNQP